jgi:hypothetical protein
MKLDRTRIIFIAIIGIAALVICGVAASSIINSFNDNDEPDVADVSDNDNTNGSTVSNVDLDSPDPIWGPNYDANDGLPTYICGADAFGSYFTLQQMQMSGKDIEQGFHLGIIPFFLTDEYDIYRGAAHRPAGVWPVELPAHHAGLGCPLQPRRHHRHRG